jgi:hypothetical protein
VGSAGCSWAPVRRSRLGLLGGAHSGWYTLNGGVVGVEWAVFVCGRCLSFGRRVVIRGRDSCLRRWGMFAVVVVVMMVLLSSLFTGSRRHERSSS